jgi:hypothetical protein
MYRLQMSISIFSLSGRDMSDANLLSLFQTLAPTTIVVLEDIDAIFLPQNKGMHFSIHSSPSLPLFLPPRPLRFSLSLPSTGFLLVSLLSRSFSFKPPPTVIVMKSLYLYFLSSSPLSLPTSHHQTFKRYFTIT